MKLLTVLLVVLFSASFINAQETLPPGPPHAFLDAMPQTGPLYLRFCGPYYLIGLIHDGETCTERVAHVWGQVCDSDVAKLEAGKEEAPEGFQYAGWRCGKKFHTPDETVFGGGNWGD